MDHLRSGNATLARALEDGHVLGLLAALPQAIVATPDEALAAIESNQLHGRGIGYVDAQLLAATLMTPDARLWTNDSRLASAAALLGCALSTGRS